VIQKKPATWHGSMGQPSMRQSNAIPPRAAVSLPSVVATACAMATMAAQPASAAQPATAAQPDTAAHSATATQSIRVRVQTGLLVGILDNAVESFKGVPYTTPPVGALRWKLPRPAAAWSGERAADDFGPSCTQGSAPRNVPPTSRGAQVSEDCLTLNVWAPQSARRAPVMVWIHGGGNDAGSSAVVYYDGTAFARDGVVLVSLNYRLGQFGFEPHDGEANFGLWDQVAALGWVRDNIASFGGDPANVTLFGESAGGEDTLALMTAVPARGLFQKAIVESGGGGWGPPPTAAHAAASHDEGAEQDTYYGLTVDGHLLKEPPLTAIAAGRAVHIPLIIGTNGEEGSLLGPDARTEGLFPKLSKDDQARLAQLYGPLASNDSTLARLEFRDGHFASEARWIATKVSATGAPAYLYRFEYVLGVLQARRTGAFHGSEIPFVFDRLPTQRLDDNDLRVTRALHGCWTAFARTGMPACADAPDWPQFGQGGKWMVFDSHPAPRAPEGAAVLDLLQCRLAEAPLAAQASCPAK
jgi:para-nitrobenzyl esterase